MNIYRFAKRTTVAGLILLLLAAGLYFAGKHLYFFLLIFAAVLLAVLFCSITNWITAKIHINRGISLFLAVVLVFGFIIGSFWLVAPTVADQFKQLGSTIPQAANKVQDWLSQYGWGNQLLQKVPDDLSVSSLMSGEESSLLSGQGSLFSKVTGFVSSTFSFFVDLLLVIVTALFFAASPKLYTEGFASLFPVRNQNRVLEVLDKCYSTLKAWMVAMLISMTIVGVSTAIAYKIIGIPMAYALAVLAFFSEFIPNIGPWLAAAPAVLVGLTLGTQTAIIVAAVYLAIQLVESYWIIPIVMKRAVELPPALLLFFQVLLGIVQGALGLLLAAPLLAVLMVVIRELWIKDVIKAKPLDAGQAHVHGHGSNDREGTGHARVVEKKVIQKRYPGES
ncbi:AI-2E family transporter [Pontibacter actiniarum]|uniref:AI-2E family transporter n=1 Tax=Pontibacter actiniarum TaxID=323450 RepID=A0A1X9YSJ6_9BACT|nr:AI-2E family transporter [Pontibacter actiniarum]ARS35833.1 AI-2E family transporter [Pontibacter actiniarum]